MKYSAILKKQSLWIAGIFCFGFLMSLLVEKYLGLVTSIGPNFPDVPGDYIRGIVWAVILGIVIWFLPILWNDRKDLFWLWVIRSFLTLFLMLLYENVYSLDALAYFRRALEHSNPLHGYS